MLHVIQESVRVPGARRLAGELAYPLSELRAMCLLANPHPYMGGRMDNNVIGRLAARLAATGVAALRFDYSGVGSSEGSSIDVESAMGEFWRTGAAPVDPLMIEDAAASLNWLRGLYRAPIFLIGYSFGAYVAASIHPVDAAGVVLISPTIKQHAFDLSSVTDLPKLVIHADDDFANDDSAMTSWVQSLPSPKRTKRIVGGQHFFRGLEDCVAEEVIAFIDETLAHASKQP
jgi:uncharacterized protein